MADDTDNLGPMLEDLAKYGVGAAGTMGANAVTQAAYQAIIKNLQDRFGDYSKLGPAGYKNLTAEKLGPSALTRIDEDPQARADEQAAIAALDEIARSGGLTLEDKAALNELEQTMSRTAGARNASIANQYAARGQLGAGQQLAMELANAQHATENANRSGENIAAEAQKRAMNAVLKKGELSHSLSREDYARKKAAADAEDAIARYNASMATDAAKYNNNVAGQSYDDQLRKLAGLNQTTGQLNTALLGSGQQNANTIAGAAYGAGGLIGGLAKTAGKLGKSGGGGGGGGGGGYEGGEPTGSSPDEWNQYPGNPDETGERGGAADLSGGELGGEEEYGDWSSLSGDGGSWA